MSSTYKSIPVFLSGYDAVTGYTCPINKVAIIKQITFANESNSSAYVDVKWCDKNAVGVGTTAISNLTFYPVIISGFVSGYSTSRALQEFLAIQENDYVTCRSPQTGRVNAIITVVEQDSF